MYFYRFYKWLLVWFLGWNVGLLSLQAQNYLRYDHYTQNQGLSNNNIECIHQDHRGFIWIGTWSGLNRFDGYTFRKYLAEPENPTGMKDDWIFSIFEDKDFQLWVATSSELLKYNWSLDQFVSIKGMEGFAVYDIKQDKKGFLWITTQEGLVKFDPAADRIIHFYKSSEPDTNLPTNQLTDLVIDGQDNLWIGTTTHGVLHFKTQVNRCVVDYPPTPSKVRSIVFDEAGRLWIGTYNEGIAILDTTTKKIVSKTHTAAQSKSISSNAISRIICDRNGKVWVCCQNGYLNLYNPNSDDFISFPTDPFIPTAINSQTISYVFADRDNNCWLGSHGNGIYFLNQQKNKFKTYTRRSDPKQALPGSSVSSFAEMDDGKIWIGMDGGGISEFDRNTEMFKTFQEKNGLPSNAVTKILRDDSKHLWIATWGGGLGYFNTQTKKSKNFSSHSSQAHGLLYDNLKDINRQGNLLWVVSHGEGVLLLDPKTYQFTSYRSKTVLPFDFRNPTWGNSAMYDSKHRLWISTNGALCMWDSTNKAYVRFNLRNKKEAGSNIIHTTLEDHQGTIWILTQKSIHYYEEDTRTCKKLTKVLGLPQDPKAIVEDHRHNLWISSGQGLYCLDASRKISKHYTMHEGLPSHDFVPRSAYCLNDGTLLFGGNFGFLMFHPDSLTEIQPHPFLYLSDVYIDHRQVSWKDSTLLDCSAQATDTLQYLYSHDLVSFQIAAVDPTHSAQFNYAYCIKGFSDAWISLGNERTFTIPNLEPGTYTLLLRAQKNNVTCVTNGNGMVLIVLPPWWKTWWFKLFVLFFAAILISGLFLIKIRAVKKRQKRLERLIESKTNHLHKALHHLNEAKQTIEEQNQELSETLSMKDKLIGMIGHDFKNPIQSIVGLLELMKLQTHSISRHKLDEHLTTLLHSSKKLSGHLTLMTHWAQSQSEYIKARPSEFCIEHLLEEAIAIVRENARQKNISISIQANHLHQAYADPRMIQLVVLNLLSNAIKFTYENGTIVVTIIEESSTIELSFIDTGIGLDAKSLAHLTNTTDKRISQTGTMGETGMGIGLDMCKDFLKQNNGTLSIQSAQGTGSSFTIRIPKGDKEREPKASVLTHQFKTSNEPHPPELLDKSILLIDDDYELVQVLQELLFSEFNIIKSYIGKSGVYLAQQTIPDLVICDINIPDLSGLDVCNLLKEDPLTRHIPIILISGEKINGLKAEGLSLGASSFFEKPFDVFELKKEVKELLKAQPPLQKSTTIKTTFGQTMVLPKSADDKLLKKIIDVLNEHYENPEWDVDRIASQIGLSRTQLWRKTKNMLGKTPSDLIRDLRLQKASEMIKSGKYRISDIAYHVGFNDPKYFSRAFTKAYGMSPTEYYNQFQNIEI